MYSFRPSAIQTPSELPFFTFLDQPLLNGTAHYTVMWKRKHKLNTTKLRLTCWVEARIEVYVDLTLLVGLPIYI